MGYTVARRALLCTLVDPTLRGVVLSGPIGTGKSALMRSFGAFVREHLDPESPFVQAPLGIGDDRLLGGLDLDAALLHGERRVRHGLLADADGGFLFVDDMPLLEERSSAAIVGALERQEVICEREGLSARHIARFTLLATVVPSERDLPVWMADKIAFLIGEENPFSADTLLLLLSRLDRYTRDPHGFYERYRERQEELAGQVATARLLHPFLQPGREVLAELATRALRLNISGNRADLFAAKAARAHAALRGSRTIEEADIQFAIATVLAPRAENVPDETRESDEPDDRPGQPQEAQDQEPMWRNGGGGGDTDSGESSQEERREDGEKSGGGGGERVYEPLDFNAGLPSLGEFFKNPGRNMTPGSRGVSQQWRRGRHTGSVQRELRGKRIAVGATLRAAAPHQSARREEGENSMVVRAEDIRVKRYSERAGTLFIFCVDASGSMAMNRMREAKGAVTRLLQDAYVNRDTVALIAFRGAEAELLLPPTNSVERAKRSLDILPTGGGTPLASALLKAYALVAAARRRGVEQALVVLLTDGRANLPLAESAAGMIMEVRRRHVRQELERLAAAYRREGIRSLVVDTRRTFGAQSEAVRLAGMLGAQYHYLSQIDAQGLAAVVRQSGSGSF